MRTIIVITLVFSGLASTGSSKSLWDSERNSERGMFADRIATSIGDIITVVIDESTTLSASKQKTSSSSSNVENNINKFFYTPPSGLGTHKGGLPGINLDGQQDYSGSGQVSNNSFLRSEAAVMVVDTLPNGNLIIEGAREVVVGGERQLAILRGIIRLDDIQPDNSVMSTRIANAQVEFMDEGAIAEAQKKGLLGRILGLARLW